MLPRFRGCWINQFRDEYLHWHIAILIDFVVVIGRTRNALFALLAIVRRPRRLGNMIAIFVAHRDALTFNRLGFLNRHQHAFELLKANPSL
jgi:hypothetical protein